MTESKVEATPAERKNGPIALVVAASLVWLIACAALFSVAKPCFPATDFWRSRLACLSANEMGDFLAGAFAPLAFLWLIAAVFLQRDELAAQRQELRESRAVSAQQVEEARKNVQLIAEQTALLKSDRERVQQREADEDIDEMISILIDELRTNVNRTYIDEARHVADTFGHIRHDAIVSVSESDSAYTELHNYSTAIRDLVVQTILFAEDGIKFHHSGAYSYSGTTNILQQISALREDASPPKKALLSAKGFDSLLTSVPRLVSAIEQHGQKDDDIPF